MRFADPYGMTGLLALGVHFTRDGVPPILQFPQSPDVAGYFTRMGFVAAADSIFEMHDAPAARGRARAACCFPSPSSARPTTCTG